MTALQCIYRAGCPNERLCQEAQRCCELHRPDTIPAARLVNSELREMPAIRLPTEVQTSKKYVDLGREYVRDHIKTVTGQSAVCLFAMWLDERSQVETEAPQHAGPTWQCNFGCRSIDEFTVSHEELVAEGNRVVTMITCNLCGFKCTDSRSESPVKSPGESDDTPEHLRKQGYRSGKSP